MKIIQLLIIILSILPIGIIYSYPITPQTLRKLIIQSKYIVLAKIENPNSPEKRYTYFDKDKQDSVTVYEQLLWGDGFANLEIQQVFKGQIAQKNIVVKYENNISNPRPPEYPDNKLVIAFLTKEDTSSYYTTIGLSYGTKIIETTAVLESYKNSIVHYVHILDETNKRKQKKATVEWLVQCALDSNIRWNGAYELSRKRHWISYYDQSKDPLFANKLTKEQKLRLENIVLFTDSISYNELCLIDFVSKKNFFRIREKILKNLDFAYFSIAKELMKKYIEITPDAGLKKIYEKAKNLDSLDNDDEENRRKIIRDFISAAKKLKTNI